MISRYIRPSAEEKLKTYENYVYSPGSKPQEPEPPEPTPKKKPDQDPMVSGMDEEIQLKLRLLDIEKQEIRMKLSAKETDKTKSDIYYQ